MGKYDDGMMEYCGWSKEIQYILLKLCQLIKMSISFSGLKIYINIKWR